MNTINDLTSTKKFSCLSYYEKLLIKANGRPVPDLDITISGSSRGKTYKRTFQKDIYSRNQWICGCNKKNALFCFPCVLFGGEKSWTESGVTDLVHLSEKIKRHENSKSHLNNQLSLSLLDNVNIQAQWDTAYWQNVHKHNEEVEKNRSILSEMIDCIKSCAAFELALRGHDNSDLSDNPGMFRGVINLSAELDKLLDEHLQHETAFQATAQQIQNDILECILDVCHEEIAKEISESPFLAVMADETTGISENSQLGTVLRYLKKGDSAPVERFWGFSLPPNRDAGTLSESLFAIVDPLVSDPNKLIAQSYDCTAVNNGVHSKIKAKYPLAYLVQCYAHPGKLIIQKSASINAQVRLFFANLQEIPGFFNHAPQRLQVLNGILNRRIPHGAPWNFRNIRTIGVVFEYRDALLECMEELQEGFSEVTINQASAIRRMLEDPVFVRWLTFFHHAMPHANILFDQLQRRDIDSEKAQAAIEQFESCITTVRTNIDRITEEASNLCDLAESEEPTRKRGRNTNKDNLNAMMEVCDAIVESVKDTFVGHLTTANLLDSRKFAQYADTFPDNELTIACEIYPLFNKERLKIELSLLYARRDFRNISGTVSFLKFINSNNLNEPLREVEKLLQLIVTIPMTTTEDDRCFSTLKKIKTFLGNTMGEEHLSAVSMLSIEKQFISEIALFNEKVIGKFASKNEHRIKLIKKKT